MKFFTSVFIACLSSSLIQTSAFAVETSMTPEAKQQALDSLANYEKELVSNSVTANTRNLDNMMNCGDETLCAQIKAQQTIETKPDHKPEPIQEEGQPRVHRVTVYFLNDDDFLDGYVSMSEEFFELQGIELANFKQAILYHYLGHADKVMDSKLVVTTKSYVGIEIDITHSELKELAQSDIRISDITHKGNSGAGPLTH